MGHVRPFTGLATDLTGNRVARYTFITPNLCDDMHDAGPPTFDRVRQRVPEPRSLHA